jgi:large subunit ribosomal protein L25
MENSMSFSLTATKRAEKGERIRKNGLIPATVYGKGADAESLSLEYSHFTKLYKQAGEASLIDLLIEGQDKGKVLIQEVQYDPVSDRVLHVDLRRIDMSKPITATVELNFVGEPPIVKEAGGTLVTSVNEVEVECLPKDLVSTIEVDLSNLHSYDDIIKIKDLKVPTGMVITSPEGEQVVAKAAPALTEEQIKAMEEAGSQQVDLNAIEVEGKKPEDGEEAAGEDKAAPEGKEDKKPEAKE